jgi:hypothetical protein
VVFVSDEPGSREAKLAYGLRQLGWQTILLHKVRPNFDPARFFSEYYCYDTPQSAVRQACRYRPIVYHVFANWQFATAAELIRYRPGPVIFDDYDVFGGIMGESFLAERRRQVEYERFCLEQANGLICRSLETQSPRRMGYRFRGPRLLLLDGCWGTNLNPTAELRFPLKDIHLVYCGNVPMTCTAQAQHFASVIGRLGDHGIHLHIYPSPDAWADTRRSNHIRFAATRADNLHLHEPVPPEHLPAELAPYHAGIVVASFFAESYDQMYGPTKCVYATTNKLFDYFDAGLPVLLSSSKFQHFLVRHFGCGVILRGNDAEQFATEIRAIEDWSRLRLAAQAAAQQLSVVRLAERLVTFYGALNPTLKK